MRYLINIFLIIAIAFNMLCMRELTKRHEEYVQTSKWQEARIQFLLEHVKFRDFGTEAVKALEKLNEGGER